MSRFVFYANEAYACAVLMPAPGSSFCLDNEVRAGRGVPTTITAHVFVDLGSSVALAICLGLAAEAYGGDFRHAAATGSAPPQKSPRSDF